MSDLTSSIDFQLSKRLRDEEFRREWFRAQLEYGVPEQFRALREEREYTQTKLAEITGMKQSAISRFEKSTDANWKFETLLTLADALDAQLQIRVVRYEDVIREFEHKEQAASTLQSVTDALAHTAAQTVELSSIIAEMKQKAEAARALQVVGIDDRQKAAFNSGTGLLERLSSQRAGRLSVMKKSENQHEKDKRYGSDWLQRDRHHEPFQFSAP